MFTIYSQIILFFFITETYTIVSSREEHQRGQLPEKEGSKDAAGYYPLLALNTRECQLFTHANTHVN